MDHTEAQAFAEQWAWDWNAHDIDGLLKHFADDVVFTSPVAIRLLGSDGVIRGKEALRKYWIEGVRLIPDLRFEVLAVYAGISTLVINYRNQAGDVVCEVLAFDGPWSGRATARTSRSLLPDGRSDFQAGIHGGCRHLWLPSRAGPDPGGHPARGGRPE